MPKVDLDALIQREDFIASETGYTGKKPEGISVSTFHSGLFHPFLRKPDFQRETGEWDANRIHEFILSYMNGDLIPSIILWRSPQGLYFVIDGAHRLSALLAWYLDDYGDGAKSEEFFNYDDSVLRRQTAENTRKLIESDPNIGKCQDIIESVKNPIPHAKASNLFGNSIAIQWVEGTAKVAEDSFFKINQQGIALNSTEIKLLKSRPKGNCISARAIKKGGKGHQYWANFSSENQIKIKEIAGQIHKIFFEPHLKLPIKSLDDLPICGSNSSPLSLPIILDTINIINKIPHDFDKKVNELPNDTNGELTLNYLSRVRQIAWRINDVHPSSLGLHPIIYFYSIDVRHKPASFYAVIAWLLEMERKNSFDKFIAVRESFETLLLQYDYLIQDISRYYRSAIKAYTHIKDFYIMAIDLIGKNISNETVIETILNSEKFSYLKTSGNHPKTITSSDFTDERKSTVFFKYAIPAVLRCSICKGLLHKNSISIDHIERRREGGKGSVENGALSHPFCNSTIKN